MGVRKAEESPHFHNGTRHTVGESSDCKERIGRVALAVIITLASFVFLPPPLAIAVGIISFTVALISPDCSSSAMSRALASSSFGCRGPSTNLGQPRQRPNHFYTDKTSLPRDNEASRHYVGSRYPSLSPTDSGFKTSPPPQRHETPQKYVGTSSFLSSSFVPSSVSVEKGSRTSPPPQRYETDQQYVGSSSSLSSSFAPPSVSPWMSSRTSPPPQRYETDQLPVESFSSFAPSFVSPSMGSRTSPPPQRDETAQSFAASSSSSSHSLVSSWEGSRKSPKEKMYAPAPTPLAPPGSLASPFVQNEKQFSSVSGEKGSRTEPKPQQHKAPPRSDASSNSSISPFASPFPLMQRKSTADPASFSSLPSSFNQGGGESPPTVSAEVGSRTGPPPKEDASGATGGRNRKKVGNG